MKTLNVMLSNLGGRVVPIGYEGENLYTRIRINCIEVFADYPDATVSMVVNSPVGQMYPAVIEKSGVMVIWDITDAVLSSNGSGECQLTFTDGDVVRKSVVFGISINRSLIASGDPPEPVQEWIDKADQTAQEIAENAANLAKEDIVESYGSIAPAIIETASGAIASLSDGADGMLVKTLNVDIDPVQDLHGYDNPWPAGCGKNLCDPSEIESGGIDPDTGGISSTPIRVVSGFIPVMAGETYVTSIESGKKFVAYHFYDSSKGNLSTSNITTNPYQAPTGASFVRVIFGKDDNTGISPSDVSQAQVEKNNTATAFAPYANICPISGLTSADVTRTGKNLFDKNISIHDGKIRNDDGTETSSGSSNYTYPIGGVLPNTKYTIQGHYCNEGTNVGRIYFLDKYLNWISRTAGIAGTTTFQTPANCYYLELQFIKNISDFSTIQIEKGESASAYETFGNTYTYTFPQSAGTVFNATLVIYQDGSGVLTPKSVGVDMGDFDYDYDSTYQRFMTHNVVDSRISGASRAIKCISSLYKCVYNGIPIEEVKNGDFYFASKKLVFHDNSFTDASAFKTARTGEKVVYPLDGLEPIPMTNQQVVSLLKGVNNVWADTGNVSLEYPADTKLYIDARVAELQALILENISNS